MRATVALAFILIPGSVTLYAQGPFQFREAYLLENRMEANRKIVYDPNHSEQLMSRMNPGLANPQYRDLRDNPQTYTWREWATVLQETDKYRDMGGLDLAEKQYLDILAALRKAQGFDASDVALMLDHLAEFYLEERKFDDAYKNFTEALKVRRASLTNFTCNPAPERESGSPIMSTKDCKLNLSEILTRLGELDLGKGDLAAASTKLSEAVAIVNSPDNLRYTNGLYAIYFQSLVLEKQSKWKEAEALWHETVKLREALVTTGVYWDAQKELAAFYARHGDFHSAAEVARQVQAGIAANHPRPQGHLWFIDNRPRDQQYSRYTFESDTAMSEILAVDAWQTSGADAAAALLKNPIDNETGYMMDRGSDSERTQLLAWYQKKIFLHMSILLDGTPSQDRINAAYTLLSAIKGRYLTSISDATRLVESERGNPGVQIPDFAILDQLAEARSNQAHLFLASAMDGKKLDEAQFIANDNRERILTSAIVSGDRAVSAHSILSLQRLSDSVATDAAFIDIVAWERSSRDGKTPPQREYGAFIARKGQPLHYVRIGAASAIDADIDALHAGVISNRQRGLQFEEQNLPPAPTPQEVQTRLKDLYKKVIAPMDPSLQGATKLYIVPDGKLTLAPISAFLNDAGHYVFETRTITYMSSWRNQTSTVFLGSLKPSPPLIVANPDYNLSFYGPATGPANAHRPTFTQLPGAAAEAADIAKTLGVSQDRVLTGATARKPLLESIQTPEILHLATHSVPHLEWTPPKPTYTLFEFPQPLDTQYPLLQSVIALAGANRAQNGPEDGLLTGLEIGSLHLDGTRLVVLSSCESGQGTLLDGQGVVGLRAAFAMAGTGAMVMTLWPVDDEAGRQFMQFFYAHLAAGPSEAVRLAQTDMLTKTTFKNPFFWSGYVASGSPVTENEQRTAQREAVAPPPPPDPVFGTSPYADKPQYFVTPNCFEFSTHDALGSQNPKDGVFNDIRVKIGGVVRRVPTDSGVIYDLHDQGNEVEVRRYEIMNGNMVIGSESVKKSTEPSSTFHYWSTQVIVDRQKDSSSVSFQFGPDTAHPEKNRRLTLKGAPGLFPSSEIPSALPPLSAYTQASDTQGHGTITKAGFCSSGPAQ